MTNFLLDGFAVLAWHLLCLLCHNIVANLMWLVFADLMRHLVAFLMGLLFAFLFSVTDCHDNIVVLAGLLSIIVLCTLQFSLFLLSGGRNLVTFRLILNVAFHIGHFSLHILKDPM